jgi:D-3-phosphoglycerate dehydrogenase
LLAQSDFISLHIPAQKEYVIGEKELAKMKASACIVNAARGGTIDEVALVKALNENKLRGAALDVFENEPTPPVQVLMQPKLSLTPHTGGATKEAQDRIGEELALQMINLLK